MLSETFKTQLWAPDGPAAWCFATLPPDLSKRIRTLTTGLRRPFGSCRVTASIGDVSWTTSLFADTRRDAFLLPVKADVRRKTGVKVCDTVAITVSLEL